MSIHAPASEAQRRFVRDLLASRIWDQPVNLDGLSRATASALITALQSAPRKASERASRTVTVTEAGMYRTADGRIYRVQPSRDSGHLYAKRLCEGGGFEYAPGAVYFLTPADRMTLAQAQAYGVETGVCCVCGAFLTDPKSVERGIGPVCARGF